MFIIATNIIIIFLFLVVILFYFKRSRKLQAVVYQFFASKLKSLETSSHGLNKSVLQGQLFPPVRKNEVIKESLSLLTEGPLAVFFRSSPAKTELMPPRKSVHHTQMSRKNSTGNGGDAYDWKQFIETGRLPHLNEIQKHELYQAFHSFRYKIKEFLDAHYEELARMGWEDIYAIVLRNYIEMKLVQLDKMNPVNLSADDVAFLERLIILRGEKSKLKEVKQPASRNELRDRLGIWGDKAEEIYRQYQTLSKRFGFHPRPVGPV